MDSERKVKVYNREMIEEKVQSSFRSSLDKLEFFWGAFGISGEQTTERANVLLSHHLALMGELVKEEENLYEDLKNRIENYLKDLKELGHQLGISPEEPDKSLSLLQREKLLRTQLDDLEQERHSRLKLLRQLQKKELKLCTSLGMPVSEIGAASAVPSKRDLCELEQHTHMLADERERRYHKFCNTKKELTTIMEVTEISPETSFERQVICYDDGDNEVVLSQENINKLKEVFERIQQKRLKMEHEKETLVEKLRTLWDRLNIDEKERCEFLSKHTDCRSSTIFAIREEIEHCEEIKKQNIGQYIGKLREELMILWDKCYISEDERQLFYPFYDEDFNEALLDSHDFEVQKLKAIHDKTKEIFEKIDKRQQLWDLMIIFERKARDPNRFTNRGGNLLQEEKERKKLLKDLPKLEFELMKAIEEYEEKNDTLFLIKGVNFAEYIKAQWDQHMQEKENEKLERQKQRNIQLEETRTPGKRPLFATPMSAPSKMRRANFGQTTLRTPGTTSRIRDPDPNGFSVLSTGKKTTTPRRRSPRLGMKNTAPYLGILTERNKPQTVVSISRKPNDTTTSYSEFAKELDKNTRERCRSSVLHSTKKVYGSKIKSHSGSLRKSSSTASFKSNKSHRKTTPTQASNKSGRNISRTPTKLTPARGKLGLPFLI